MKGLTREYMIGKLTEWNPHWTKKDVQNIESYTFKRLCGTYADHRQKTLKDVFERYGLPFEGGKGA